MPCARQCASSMTRRCCGTTLEEDAVTLQLPTLMRSGLLIWIASYSGFNFSRWEAAFLQRLTTWAQTPLCPRTFRSRVPSQPCIDGGRNYFCSRFHAQMSVLSWQARMGLVPGPFASLSAARCLKQSCWV